MTKHATEYQADGFVDGFSTKSLAEANRQLAMAKNNTPEKIRNMFRSQIRSITKDSGYLWTWCIN
jgi:hypothetical protein